MTSVEECEAILALPEHRADLDSIEFLHNRASDTLRPYAWAASAFTAAGVAGLAACRAKAVQVPTGVENSVNGLVLATHEFAINTEAAFAIGVTGTVTGVALFGLWGAAKAINHLVTDRQIQAHEDQSRRLALSLDEC